MKKSLSILLCVCLIMTTIYGCFTFTASAEEIKNYWTYGDYEDAPEGLVSCTNGSALNSYGYYFSNDAKDAIESTLSDDAYEGDYAWRMLTSNVQTGNKVGRIVSIDPGYRYEVSFMYKGGSASTNTYPFALYKADTDTVPTVSSSDYANEIQIADTDWSYIFHPAGWSWPKTDVWTNYTTSFTAGENDAYFGLIATNSAVSEIFFDNFTIRKVEDIKGYNYFEHGDADSAPDGYINATNGFGTSTTACSFRITNDNGNKVYEDHAWAEHYIWRTMDVQPGTDYVVSFDYKSPTYKPWHFMLVAHDDKAVVGKNAYTGPDDGNTHFTVLQNLEWAFGTQSDWTHYTYKVNTGDFGYLDFYLSNSGGEPDDIFFDNISVYRASDICTVEAEVNVNNHPGQSKGGTATASLPTVLPGSSVTLTATANEGFTFDAWYVNGAAVSYNATETVTVDANTVYVANFVSDGLFNYIDNGDFESTDDSEHHKQSNVWTTDGNMNKIYTPETPDYDAANVHSGNNSFCLSNLSVQGVGNNWWQIPLKEGQSYVLKFYFKGVQMGMGIGLSDKTDVKLPTAWDGIGSMFNPLVTQIEKLGWGKMGFKDAWQEFSYNIDVPTTKDADDVMYLTILFCTNGHTAYVDDFTLYTAGAAAYVKTDVGVNGAAGHNAGGSASASATSVAPGGQVTLTATANEGFTFDGWYVDGKLVSTANPYVATVTKDTTFLANFKSDEPFNVWDYGDVDSAPEGYISAANGFNGSGGCGFKVYTEEDTGNKALNLSAAWDNYGYRNIGLKGGGTYKLEFDYKTVVSKPWVFELVCHNNADTVTYNTGNAGVTGAGTKVLYKPGDWSFASPEWSHQSFTFTMDKDKPYLCLFVSVSGDFSTILFDNIKITEQQKAAPTVYLNGKEVDNNDYAVADVYTISEDAEITVTENEYPGLTFNGWYAPSDLENAISTEATYTYTQKFGQPNVVAKFTGAANLFTYAGVEGIDNSVYNNAANGWFVTANNGDAGIVGRSISTEEAHTGTQSYCMSYKYIHGMGRSITLEAGKSYRLNFWYKATAENLFLFQIGNRKSTTSRVVRSDDGMVFDDDHINAFTGEQFALVSKDWELFTADFTLDEDKDTIDLLFLQSGDVCNPFYIDDFSLIEVAGFSQLDYADNTDSYDMVRVYNISKPNISITYKYPATAQAAGQVIKFKLYNGEEPQNYTELIGTNPFDQIAEIENGVWTLKYYTMDGLDRTSAESTVVFRIQDDAATFCKDYTPGDVFADGEEWVNEQDVEALLKYIAGYEVEGLTKYSKALDVNGDRVIDEKDAFILDRYVAGWDVELKRGR